MNRTLFLLALLAAGPLRAEPRLDGAGVSIPRNAVNGGGRLCSGGGLTLDGAAGEAAVFTFASVAGSGYLGLMNEIAQPGSVVSLTAATKSTGTLNLAWNAPGLDSFTGGVASGFWRLDYSSDPAHVFAPTAYALEFATSVVPGAPQSYLLTGLLPDTTYYARVYLADARKYFAETSASDADSTLARVPAAPVFTGVFPTSVTISWTLPAGGAQGYLLDASTTGFVGGTVVGSGTANGAAVTLTISGLTPGGTYFFKVGSLDWQSDVDFNSVMSTVTPAGGPPPVFNLALAADNLARRVTLTWTNPAYPNPAGVTIVVSTNPIAANPSSGAPYPPGSALSDGSVIKSSAPTPAASYVETGLTLDVTGYFALYSRDVFNAYSIAVTTSVVLDLPPMAPAGLSGTLSTDGSSITLNWWQVSSNLDGSGFKLPAAPAPFELNRYEVFRSTGIVLANWVYVGSAPAAANSYVAAVPVPGAAYYYKVVSRDGFQSSWTDAAMAVDTLGNLFALDADQITRLQIPAALAGLVQPAGNPSGSPLLVRADDRPQDLGGRVVRSVSFDPVMSPSNRAASVPPGPAPLLDVALHYDTAGGVIVPSGLRGASAARLAPLVNAADAANGLTAYYANSIGSAKVYGAVDPLAQTVSVQAPYLGNYQIRSVMRTQDFNFDVSGISNKVITPDGDGVNDAVVFTFSNPHDAGVSGRILDMRGRVVATMTPGPLGAGLSLMWDGRAGGAAVPQGVYAYQISAEGRSFSGTVVVIR